jgi:hypothetical protein
MIGGAPRGRAVASIIPPDAMRSTAWIVAVRLRPQSGECLVSELRGTRLVDVVGEDLVLAGIDSPLRIGGLSVSPGRLSDVEYGALLEVLVGREGART